MQVLSEAFHSEAFLVDSAKNEHICKKGRIRRRMRTCLPKLEGASGSPETINAFSSSILYTKAGAKGRPGCRMVSAPFDSAQK